MFAGPVTGGIVGIGCVAACELCDPTWFQSPLLLVFVIIVNKVNAPIKFPPAESPVKITFLGVKSGTYVLGTL